MDTPEKIGIYELNLLATNEQADYLWNNGEFITNAIQHGGTYQLHVLHDFYVELEYHAVQNRVTQLKSFKTSTLLEPYLNQLKFEDWF